jgi:hypothetical protein
MGRPYSTKNRGLTPLRALLDGREIEVAVQGVHLVQIAGGMVVDGARGVEAVHHLLDPRGSNRVPVPSVSRLALRVGPGRVNPVDELGIHALQVPGDVMAGRVHYNGRVVLGLADIELGVLRIAVGLLRILVAMPHPRVVYGIRQGE